MESVPDVNITISFLYDISLLNTKFRNKNATVEEELQQDICKATITGCDLSPRLFVLIIRYLKVIRYESTSLNRIVADKLHRVIVA